MLSFRIKGEQCERRLVKLHSVFGKPHGILCPDNHYEKYSVPTKINVPSRVAEKGSA